LLLKFALDRSAYRAKLRADLVEFETALLGNCIACNLVHLFLNAAERGQIGGLMRTVAREFARAYNRRFGSALLAAVPCHTFASVGL
jgi:hypothetical protein